jgi:PAS domain S-box-containing protein
MIFSEILSAKRSNHLPKLLDKIIEFYPSVDFNITVAEAVAIRNKYSPQQCANAVVVNNSVPIGILTNTDIVQQMAIGQNLELVKVADAITQPLVTLTRAQITDFRCILDTFENENDYLLIFGDNGEIEGVITKTSIFSALKDVLLEQENSCVMMHNVFNIVTDGIFVYNMDTGRLVETNPAAYKMHGYSREELLTIPATQHIHKDSHYTFVEFNQAAKSGYNYYNKAIGVRKDGTAFDGEVRGIGVKLNGKMFAVAAVTDVSSRTKLEAALENLEQRTQELAVTNAELARATRMKDEFLANMGHELRTPLNAVLGLSEGLLDEVYAPLTVKQKKAISSIQTCGRHLLELINEILDLAKVEAGKLEINKSLVDIGTLCRSISPFVLQLAYKKNIKVSLQIASDVEKAWIDELRIRQVLINLLNNAVKFTLEGGNVKLSANVKQELKQIHFMVEDTGIGIDAGNLSKIFQPFIQIESSLSRKYSGTGLGLALVKKIVNLHGGNVNVSSQIGKGSCFTVILPYITTPDLNNFNFTSQENFQNTELSVITSSILLNYPSILIVDDNCINAELISDFLIQYSYKPIIALDGLEAIQIAKLYKPQLIIMDVQMPQIDGLTAIQSIREIPELSKTPIIALTALPSEDKQRCLQAGASEFLNKPVSLKYLNYVIQKLLNRSYE